jgi:hypothetical protein
MRAQGGMQAFGTRGRGYSREDELEVLKSQADQLKEELDLVQARVRDIELSKTGEKTGS